jgi:hypothetical protein
MSYQLRNVAICPPRHQSWKKLLKIMSLTNSAGTTTNLSLLLIHTHKVNKEIGVAAGREGERESISENDFNQLKPACCQLLLLYMSQRS